MNKQCLVTSVIVAALAAGSGYLYARRQAAPAPTTAAESTAATLAHVQGGAAAHLSSLPGTGGSHGSVITVKDGDSIQDAVARAKPGDTVQILPGTYRQTVYIDKDDIALVGVIRGADWPTFDGEGKRNDAVLYSGNGVRVENLKIVNFKGNAIMGQAGNNFVIRHNWIANAGVYGIFPEFAQNGLIEYNVLTGIEDAAIYVGMSDNIHVAHNEVYGNVAGIEIENSRHAVVEHNLATDNAAGILTFVTPGLPIKTTFDVIIRNNFVVANNHKNFAAVGSIVSGAPSGSGIIIMAAADVIVENNMIRDNKNAGIIVSDHKSFANITPDPETDPNPERIQVLHNLFANNGYEPMKEIRALMAVNLTREGPDLVGVGGGAGSCIADRDSLKILGVVTSWGVCTRTSTADVTNYLLDKPAPPREISTGERGKLIYSSVCAGCHAYNVRMIGPPTQILQVMYAANPQGIADYIAAPVKKRDDFPAMPPQAHLSPELRLAVAQYMLSVNQPKPAPAAP
ncbi:MAG TPA: parallel beta-helix domain-containing protein [Steroidobacteraceae bacterium]|nr:parallel beta-helix domain-containing protein [Steroidobacteraceae bacterium]